MKTINAYIYPTPEEFDRQVARYARNHLSMRDSLDLGTFIHEHLPPIGDYDPVDDSIEMTDVERIVRDSLAETLGLPKEAFVVSQRRHSLDEITNDERSRMQRWLRKIGVKKPATFIPNAPDEFVWRSHDGKKYNISDMATKHLFYSLRMIYNHTVAPVFRVLRPGETMNYYPDVPHWSKGYRQRAIDAFVAELKDRDDLDEDLARQYADMKANTNVILALGL